MAKLFRICKYQSVKSDRRRQDILDQAWIESALVVGKVWYLLSFDPELIVFTRVCCCPCCGGDMPNISPLSGSRADAKTGAVKCNPGHPIQTNGIISSTQLCYRFLVQISCFMTDF